jgi:hypothetical protein
VGTYRIWVQTHHLHPGIFHKAIFNGKVPYGTSNAAGLEREVYRWHTWFMHCCENVGLGSHGEIEAGVIHGIWLWCSSVSIHDDHSGKVVECEHLESSRGSREKSNTLRWRSWILSNISLLGRSTRSLNGLRKARRTASGDVVRLSSMKR